MQKTKEQERYEIMKTVKLSTLILSITVMTMTVLPYQSSIIKLDTVGMKLKLKQVGSETISINDYHVKSYENEGVYASGNYGDARLNLVVDTNKSVTLTIDEKSSPEAINIIATNEKSIPLYKDESQQQILESEIKVPSPVGLLYQKELDKTDEFIVVGVLPVKAEVVELIRKYFPVTEWSRAERVASCESGMRSNATSRPNVNQTKDIGVFQLNDGGTLQGLLSRMGYSKEQTYLALNAEWNVMAAHKLWTERGWAPWVCASKLGIVEKLWSSKPGPNW